MDATTRVRDNDKSRDSGRGCCSGKHADPGRSRDSGQPVSESNRPGCDGRCSSHGATRDTRACDGDHAPVLSMAPAGSATPPPRIAGHIAGPSDSRFGEHSRISLLGVELDNLTAAQTIDRIVHDVERGVGGWVLTPNLDILRALSGDPKFAELCSTTTLRVADGMPLVWASRLQRTPLVERVAGSDLIWTLTARAAALGMSVYFLGGNPGAAEAAAARLKELNPTLQVVGTDCPPIGFESDPDYVRRMQHKLISAAPDICFVALGHPKQDRLIRQLTGLLPSTWFLGVGISFSFISGEVRRAPAWMRLSGLEWLHRLVQEPRRLGKRYLIHGIPFGFYLLGRAACAGLMGKGPSRPASGQADAEVPAPDLRPIARRSA